MIIKLKVRPRWKRVFWIPYLLQTYRRVGIPWRQSVRMVWLAVTYRGRWNTEPQS